MKTLMVEIRKYPSLLNWKATKMCLRLFVKSVLIWLALRRKLNLKIITKFYCLHSVENISWKHTKNLKEFYQLSIVWQETSTSISFGEGKITKILKVSLQRVLISKEKKTLSQQIRRILWWVSRNFLLKSLKILEINFYLFQFKLSPSQ